LYSSPFRGRILLTTKKWPSEAMTYFSDLEEENEEIKLSQDFVLKYDCGTRT